MNTTRLKLGSLSLLCGLALALLGCGAHRSAGPVRTYAAPPPVASQGPQIRDITTHMQAAAAADGDAATVIRTNATAGKLRTPPDLLPVLAQFWDAILAAAERLNGSAQNLAGLQQRLDELARQSAGKDAETAGLRTALAAANAAIAQERSARLQAEESAAKARSDQAARLEKLLFGVAITSLLGLGAAVTIGLLLHDIRISIAGGAGCLAMAIGCFLLGEVIHYRFWILCTLGVAAATMAIYEFLCHRQQLAAALQVPPKVVCP